jgi:hypothetical protein
MPLALLPQLIEPRKVPGEELEGNDTEGIDIPAFSTITREVTRGDLLGTGVKEQVTGLETLDPAHKNLSKIVARAVFHYDQRHALLRILEAYALLH